MAQAGFNIMTYKLQFYLCKTFVLKYYTFDDLRKKIRSWTSPWSCQLELSRGNYKPGTLREMTFILLQGELFNEIQFSPL